MPMVAIEAGCNLARVCFGLKNGVHLSPPQLIDWLNRKIG